MELLALTDHDTVDGIDEALAAGAEHGVQIVPATEISAVDGEFEDLHILGYGIDHHDPVLASRLLEARGDRERRAEAMAARLNELGFEIDPAPVAARRAAGKPVGRPHLAAAVLAHPANAERLEREGHADVSSFIPAYLIQGTPGYVARTHPTVSEAIRWIHDAGGVAVWAHPFWDISDEAGVLAAIDRYQGAGLDGVEAFYVTHTPEQTALVAARCRELGLLSTGSSDYHGPDHRLFSRFQAFELHGLEPELGPIAEVPASTPALGAGRVRVAHGPLRLGEVHRGHARHAHAEGTRPPGGADRRGRDPRGPLLRTGLHARGPRHQRAPDRVRGRHPLPQRRGGHRGRDLALPPGARGGAGAHGRALRGGARPRLGGGVRAPGREGPLRAGAGRGDRELHRRLGPLRGAARGRADARHRERVAPALRGPVAGAGGEPAEHRRAHGPRPWPARRRLRVRSRAAASAAADRPHRRRPPPARDRAPASAPVPAERRPQPAEPASAP